MTRSEMYELLRAIEFEGWQFYVSEGFDHVYLQAKFDATDGTEQKTRKWLISRHATKSEIVQTAFKCVLTALEHEAREHFLYRDKAIFGPHYDVDALHEIVERTDAREAK